ncbi:MAG: 16S rRNA (guanine(966)-N(2))-methyltransferase RsmD [Anaerolineaceae bacterium]|nr:16S rRNA (guanine(966)-N(2))-methyltransferase RsmD [Anaerolineaceae bacterium]
MSSPRIIAGKARGIRIESVPGNITRPITDRVKEALFNILGNDIIDADFLDLFGGTGSVGLEALSRGARFVRFVDNHRMAISIIKENLQKTRLGTNAEILTFDAFKYISGSADLSFDYIFIAPPQYKGIWEKILIKINENIKWLHNEGWVIVQIDPLEYSEHNLDNLREFDQRKYSNTLLVFYERT